RSGERRAVGQLPADLLDGGPDPVRDAPEPELGGRLLATPASDAQRAVADGGNRSDLPDSGAIPTTCPRRAAPSGCARAAGSWHAGCSSEAAPPPRCPPGGAAPEARHGT